MMSGRGITDPNTIKVQNFLQGLTPQQFAMVAKYPNPQIPSLLISMESERRIKEDQVKKNAMAQPPLATVKDQVVNQVQQLANPTPTGLGSLSNTQVAQAPQTAPTQMMAKGGVAGLDTGDMYSADSFAAGGIVAFQEGGYNLPSDYDPAQEYEDYLAAKTGLPEYYPPKEILLGDKKTPLRIPVPFSSMAAKTQGIKDLQARTRTPYDPAIEYYKEKGYTLKPGQMDPNNPLTRLENERQAWFKGQSKIQNEVFPDTTKKDTAGAKDTQPKQDEKAKDLKDKLANVDKNYKSKLDAKEKEELAKADDTRERILNLFKDDPYRDEMKQQLAKEKENLFWTGLGDLGKSWSTARRGEEWAKTGEGLGNWQTRVAALDQKQKDFAKEQQKLDRDLKILAETKGIESEQFKETLKAKYDIARMAKDAEIEKGKLIYGYKEQTLDLNVQKEINDQIAAWDKTHPGVAQLAGMDPNAKGIGEEKRNRIISAINARTAEINRIKKDLPRYNKGYGATGGLANFDPTQYTDFTRVGE